MMITISQLDFDEAVAAQLLLVMMLMIRNPSNILRRGRPLHGCETYLHQQRMF
jgi:hypothetical protein